MKLGLGIALAMAAVLALGGCGIDPSKTEGELLYPRELSTSYTCSIDEWEAVKRRIKPCEEQSWGSKPFAGCPAVAIMAECTWKGQEIDDNRNISETPPTPPPNELRSVPD